MKTYVTTSLTRVWSAQIPCSCEVDTHPSSCPHCIAGLGVAVCGALPRLNTLICIQQHCRTQLQDNRSSSGKQQTHVAFVVNVGL